MLERSISSIRFYCNISDNLITHVTTTILLRITIIFVRSAISFWVSMYSSGICRIRFEVR